MSQYVSTLRASFRANPQLAGIACIVAGMSVILGNDVAIKWMSGDYPIHQIVLTRTLIAIPITLFVLARLEGGWRTLRSRRPLLNLARGLLITVANLCYFLALAAMPLADTMALFYVAPLLITALSVPLLGERVGPRRWLAVLAGMLGVVVMLRPSGSLQLAALLPLGAALCYALMQMLTRRVGAHDSAAAMALSLQLVFLVVSASIGLAIGDGRFAGSADPSLDFLLRAWHWPDASGAAAMVLCGVCVGFGGYLLTQAYRLGEASVVAPFEYAALPLGVLAGFLVWGDVPGGHTVLGALLVVGSGLYVLYRERRRHPPSARGVSARR